MKVLVIDDSEVARGLVTGLKQQLKASSIHPESPTAEETPETFAERVLEVIADKWSGGPGIVVIRAEIQCGGRTHSSCPGLDILEYLLAKKALAAVVLSFLEDPIQYSASQRLTDEQGNILLRHNTILHKRLPVNSNSLAQQIRTAAMWPQSGPERLRTFRVAFYERIAATIRHRVINLRAALRMLNGVRQLNLLTREEYYEVINTLKGNHSSADADLDRLQRESDSLPWPDQQAIQGSQLTKKVLLVDDQAESCAWRLILKPLCRSLGAEIDAAITIEQAESKLSDSPDAVLLDLHYLNVEVPPDPFEVLARARNANPLVPIIIFTTEQEGRQVRDLSKDAFHYFFKEVKEGQGADTRMYAENFRRILQSAMQTSLSFLLQGLVRLCIPPADGNEDRFDRARNLLELASTAIKRPEVALSLITGAVLEARVSVAGPQSRAAWTHLTNLFGNLDADPGSLRRALPDIVRMHRNYASHYEQPQEPLPTSLDAVVYFLSATQFIADLRAVIEGNLVTTTRENERRQSLGALGRICFEVWSEIENPIVLDSTALGVLQNLITSTEDDLRQLMEAKCNVLQASGKSPFSSTRSTTQAFLNVLNVWFGDGLPNLPMIDWHRGRQVAPYLLHVCRFLLLERVAQKDASLAVRP